MTLSPNAMIEASAAAHALVARAAWSRVVLTGARVSGLDLALEDETRYNAGDGLTVTLLTDALGDALASEADAISNYRTALTLAALADAATAYDWEK